MWESCDGVCEVVYVTGGLSKKKNKITMVKPFAGSHGMAMLFLAAPSLQLLRVGLVERAVEGFY